jgi:hypothetical protein
MVVHNSNFVLYKDEFLQKSLQGTFCVLVTGFTRSQDHELSQDLYTRVTRPSALACLMRLKRSFSKLVVLRGSKNGEANVDSMIDEVCRELDIPQWVFSCKHWLSQVQEDRPVYYFESENPESGEATSEDARRQFQTVLPNLADLVITFGGGNLAFNMVTEALRQKKPSLLLSVHSALDQNDQGANTIERIVERVKVTPGTHNPTLQAEIDHLALNFAKKILSLQKSRAHDAPAAASPQATATFRTAVGSPKMKPGVYQNSEGKFVVRYLINGDKAVPDGYRELKHYTSRGKKLVERVFQKTRLVPSHEMQYVLQEFAHRIPLGAIGYSGFNDERERSFGIDMSLYEKFVTAVMHRIPVSIHAQAGPIAASFCYVFGGSGSGVDLGIMEAAKMNGIPILGVVWQEYLKYAVDEDVTIIYTPTNEEYANTYGRLMVGGAIIPLGGAAHSLEMDMLNWLSQPGESLMLINRLMEIFTERETAGIATDLHGQRVVHNAVTAFTQLVTLVPAVLARKLPDATVQTLEKLLWRINRKKELELMIHNTPII